MTIFNYINYINLLVFVETFIFSQIIAYPLIKRKNYILRLILTFVGGSLISLFFPALFTDGGFLTYIWAVFMYIFILFINIVCVGINVKGNLFSYLFCCSFGYLMHHSCSKVLSLFGYALFKGDSFYNHWYTLFYVICMILMIIGFGFFYYNIKLSKKIMERKNSVLLASIVVILNIVISALDIGLRDEYVKYYSIVNSIYSLISCIVVIFMAFNILQNEYLHNENKIVKDLYKENMRQYEVSKATMESLHDLKHLINAVIDGKLTLTKEEKNDINDKIFIFDNHYNSENETLDIILTEKAMMCKKMSIELYCMVDGKKISFMDIYDIYSLFGNALSNAIEAVSKLSSSDPKYISLVIKGKDNMVSVHMENTFNGNIMMENGIPQTNKDDKMSHGFGVKSIINISEKYNGNVTITVKDNLYILDILFIR